MNAKFSKWAFNLLFWFKFAAHNHVMTGQTSTMDKDYTWKDRIIIPLLLDPWYNVYSRIMFLNGDATKVVYWTSKK